MSARAVYTGLILWGGLSPSWPARMGKRGRSARGVERRRGRRATASSQTMSKKLSTESSGAGASEEVAIMVDSVGCACESRGRLSSKVPATLHRPPFLGKGERRRRGATLFWQNRYAVTLRSPSLVINGAHACIIRRVNTW